MDIDEQIRTVARLVEIGNDLDRLGELPLSLGERNERAESLLAERRRLRREFKPDEEPTDLCLQSA
jgi:hypothetical protein